MVTAGTFKRPPRSRVQPGGRKVESQQVHLRADERKDANKSFSIAFELSANTMVTLAIFDEEGRLVDVPFEGWLWPGRHKVDCCLEGRSAGKYKCLLDTPTVRLVKFIEMSVA